MMSETDIPILPARPSLVAVDLDGTLLDSNTILQGRGRLAIERLLAQGIPTVVATARAARSVSAILGPELFAALHVVHVDGAVVEARGERPARQHFALATDAAVIVTEVSRRVMPEARVVVELDGWEFGCDQEMAPDRLWAENRATPEMVLTVEQALQRPVAKIAVNGFGQRVRPAEDVIRRELGSAARLVSHADGTFFSVVAPGVGKREGVGHVLREVGGEWADALAFGDDLSDIDLLATCGYGFAMGNAAPEVVSAAPYQTLANDDDGVAVVLECLFG